MNARGRPAIHPRSIVKDVVFAVRLDRHTAQLLLDMAQRDERKRAAVIRQLVNQAAGLAGKVVAARQIVDGSD